MTRPLNTEVMANDTPVTVPTMPLALSRRSSGTSSVTQVDRAMPRMLPGHRAEQREARRAARTTGCGSRSSVVGVDGDEDARWPARSSDGEIVVASTIAACLRWRSTKVPKTGPRNADERLNAPPITPVATTERVSRYTQNVSANHRNELVTPLTSVLTSRARKRPAASVAWGVVGRHSEVPDRSSLLGRRTVSPVKWSAP